MELIKLEKIISGEVKKLNINSQEELENANELLRLAKITAKEIKDEHDPICKELSDKHKKATTARKEALAPYLDCEKVIKKAIGSYAKEQEKLRIEAEKQQEEEIEILGETITDVQETVIPQGTNVRHVWKARVVDDKKVPLMYKKMFIRKVDESKLNQIAENTKGEVEIEGVEFYQDSIVTVR